MDGRNSIFFIENYYQIIETIFLHGKDGFAERSKILAGYRSEK